MSKEGMATQALAGEISAAVLADENDGGCDISAGLFGPAFSAIIRKIATEYMQPATSQEVVGTDRADELLTAEMGDFGVHDPQACEVFDRAVKVISRLYAAPVAAAPAVGRDVRSAIAGLEGSVAVGYDGEWVSVRRAARDEAVMALRNVSLDCAHIYAAYSDAKASTPAAPGIDLEQFKDLIGFAAWSAINLPETDPRRDFIRQASELLALIDASPKGGSRGRYFCDGPEGHFFCDDLKLARDLVNAYDKDDDWTITDLQATSAEVGS